MERYKQYKDSGVEWIGEIPADWEVVPIKYNLLIPITDGPHETPTFVIDGIPFISAEAIKNDQIDFDKKRGYITIEEHKRYSAKYHPKIGDVYMVKSGATTGNVARLTTECDFNIWSPLAALRPHPKYLTSDFLFFFMKSREFFSAVELGWNYGTQQNIGMNVLENIRMVRPTLLEQSSIANYLDCKTARIKTLISQKERLLELYEEEKTAIINQAITEGINPDASLEDSGVEWLGEIPVGWKVKRLRYTGECKNGVSAGADYFGSGHPFVSYSDVYKNPILPEVVDGLAQSSKEDQENYSVIYGDVLFTRTSETVDEIGLTSTCLKTISDAIFAGFLIRYRPSASLLHPEFSKYYFRSTLHRRFFVKEMNLVTRASLSQELLKKMPVLLPSIDEQKNIAEFLDVEVANINARIRKTKRIIELQKEYRTALISEVVTGKVKVPNLENYGVVP